jgi:hypothetical protein
MTRKRKDPITLADEVFEKGLDATRLAAHAKSLGDDLPRFVARLGARAAIEAAAEASQRGGESELATNDPLVAKLEKLYFDSPDVESVSELARLNRPESWLAAEGALGGDRVFIMKLCERRISPPPPKSFLQCVADALGVALASVQEFFATGVSGDPVAEYKGRGKPRIVAPQDFKTALDASEVPEELKRRWLQS